MNKKIFFSSFLASLMVLLISFTLVVGVLYEHFETQIFKELESEAGYISHALEKEGISYIESYKNDDKRITVVSPDGVVLSDNLADESTLDNHSDRKEIKEALQTGSGTSYRYSDTLMRKTLYYAVKMENGNILRVSTTQSSVVVILLGLLQPFLFIVALAIVISAIFSQRVSKVIIKPLNELDLENPSSNETYEELTPILHKLSAQKKTIDKQIKDANKRQEEFKLITENMSEGLIVIDTQYNVIFYNQAAIRLLEIDNTQIESVLAFNRTKGFREAVEKALNGNRAENSIAHEDSTYNLIANPVYEDERIIGAVIVILDVTESVKREQLRREFTSNISHELKTPLTSISGFAEIMKTGNTPCETVVDFSSSIYDEAQRLINLVSDIIKISELDENAVQFTDEKIDIFEVSKEVVKRLESVAKKQSVKINVIGDSAYVSGVRKIIDEIVYNLCDNAIKYNKENGIVDVIVNTTEEKVNLTVRDTGIGIPKNEQNRVFERFYRVDKSHSKQLGGTGLGLAIVKHAALYHNAQISLESTEGVGTSVTVSFNKFK
ncbi:MAG: sensor histidine kinase [Clostridia bacterium]